MNLRELKMAAGVGLFIRAYHTRHDILTDSISTAIELIQAGHNDVDALAVATIEVFPNGRLNRHDPVQVLAIRILTEFMAVVHLTSLENAVKAYNEAVEFATQTLEASPTLLSQRAVYSFLENSVANYDAQYPINHVKHNQQNAVTSLIINRYLAESIEHFHLG